MVDNESLLLIGSIPYMFIIIFGVSGNVVFAIGSIASKKLESAIHHFIVISAVADTFVLLIQILKLYTLYAKVTMAQSTCLYILFLPMTGNLASSVLLLVQGVDRLLAAAFPLFVRLCTIYDALNGVSDTFFFHSSVAIHAFNCLIYCIAWHFIKRSIDGSAAKHLFVSLFLTVSLVVLGWGISCFISIVVSFFTTDADTQTVVRFYGSLFALVGCASNPYIYIARNKDYRDAVLNLFKRKSQNTDSGVWASSVHKPRRN